MIGQSSHCSQLPKPHNPHRAPMTSEPTQHRKETMKAIKFETSHLAHVVEIPKPEPAPGNVVLRVTSTGVCGSDLSALHGTHLFRHPPLISGHEGGGVVEAIGEGVTTASIGDRVVIDPQKPCGTCELCTTGKYHLCANKTMLGVPEWDGCFADYVEVPAYTLIPAPDNVPDQFLALAEPIAVAAHAVRQAEGRRRDTALVLGGGTIGSLITRVLSDTGSTVTTSEPREFLHETIRQLGATTVTTPQNLGDDLYDAVFIVAGVGALVQQAFAHCKPGGVIVQVAVFNHDVPIHVGKLQVAEQAFVGTATYQKQDFATALDLLDRYPNIPELIVSKVTGMEEGAALTTTMAEDGPGDILKLIIVPSM